MKKFYLSLLSLISVFTAGAQSFSNPGMETWHINVAGSFTPQIVTAPNSWSGMDSTIIALGQYFSHMLSLGIADSAWQTQLYKDSGANAHGGMYAAKIVTKNQDTLGVFPGILTNAVVHIPITISGPGTPYFTGGTAVRDSLIDTVSAWVKYTPASSTDSGTFTVSALKNILGIDSVIGSGVKTIGATSGWIHVSCVVSYPDPQITPDTIRVNFSSSMGGPGSAVNSTMWVDDITMHGKLPPISVKEVANDNSIVVYPNPATNNIYVGGLKTDNATIKMYSVDGKNVVSQTVNNNSTISLKSLSNGTYFYEVTSETGVSLKKGTVSVAK